MKWLLLFYILVSSPNLSETFSLCGLSLHTVVRRLSVGFFPVNLRLRNATNNALWKHSKKYGSINKLQVSGGWVYLDFYISCDTW